MKKVLGIALLIIIIDQASKIYIKTHFELGQSIEVFKWFRLSFVENPGMAYGVQFGGETGKIILSILRLFLIGAMIYFIFNWVKKSPSKYIILPASFILAGAIGNLIDNLLYGIIFNSGTTFDPYLGEWIGYSGISKLNFQGYAPIFGGCVVDMFYFPLFNYTIPNWVPIIGGNSGTFFSYIFNVADSAITIGGIILFIFRNKIFPKGWL